MLEELNAISKELDQFRKSTSTGEIILSLVRSAWILSIFDFTLICPTVTRKIFEQ